MDTTTRRCDGQGCDAAIVIDGPNKQSSEYAEWVVLVDHQMPEYAERPHYAMPPSIRHCECTLHYCPDCKAKMFATVRKPPCSSPSAT
ncbi:hypothetical protein LCGC14_2490620 [marine sediment metagenome]|uniref:Uncharacterized protein n=1 Tax=marine sediment metagenome TaxID=412755 RepID=A0A0F9DYM2_9ZZZZ